MLLIEKLDNSVNFLFDITTIVIAFEILDADPKCHKVVTFLADI